MVRAVTRTAIVIGVTAAAVAVLVSTSGLAVADTPSTVTSPTVQQVSADTEPAYAPVKGQKIQHQTEVEPDTFSWGSTVVSAFQVGRNSPTYGAQTIGFATSVDNGRTWTSGVLPGLTASSPDPNPAYPTAVNESVAYSAANGTWIVPAVTYAPYATTSGGTSLREKAILVPRSTDGLTWSDPVVAVATNADKEWSTCDNTATSPYYGRCYIAYSQIDAGDTLAVVESGDGGATWSAPVNVPAPTASGLATGYNTNLVAQPSGNVVIVYTDLKNGANGSVLSSTVSSDGGATWSAPSRLATISYHVPVGGVRALNKPSIDVDAAGTLYVGWADCRFRVKCAHDDLVYATSSNGTKWSAPVRVPLDATTSTTDRFIPGLAVAPGTSGATAQISVVSYVYQLGACGASPKPACVLDAQYATSYDGGATWSTPYTIDATPMPPGWLAYSTKGRMVGDYLSISFCAGSAITVTPLATAAPNPGFHESIWALTMPVGG